MGHPSGAPEQQPEAGPTPAAPGFYLVGSKNLDPASFHQSGDMQFFSWAELNPADGVYNFARIQQFISDHYIAPGPNQPGKMTAISITPYDGRGGDGAQAMPAWVRDRPNTTINGVLTEQVRNGTFDTGNLNPWDTPTLSPGTTDPHSGSYCGQDGRSAGTTAELSQYSIRIPKVLRRASSPIGGVRPLQMALPDPGDRLIMEILDGNNVVVQVQNQANLGNQGWQQVTFDLRPYDGHWSTVQFKVVNDSDTTITTVWIDDISLQVQPILPKFWDDAYLTPTAASYRQWATTSATKPGSTSSAWVPASLARRAPATTWTTPPRAPMAWTNKAGLQRSIESPTCTCRPSRRAAGYERPSCYRTPHSSTSPSSDGTFRPMPRRKTQDFHSTACSTSGTAPSPIPIRTPAAHGDSRPSTR